MDYVFGRAALCTLTPLAGLAGLAGSSEFLAVGQGTTGCDEPENLVVNEANP